MRGIRFLKPNHVPDISVPPFSAAPSIPSLHTLSPHRLLPHLLSPVQTEQPDKQPATANMGNFHNPHLHVVHICTRRSSAQLQQVIFKHSHGHLFLLLDIIMGIPIQAQAIPMNACDVKAILRYIESDTSESDATSQIDDLTSSTMQTASYTHALPQHRHLPAREDGKTRLRESNILTKR